MASTSKSGLERRASAEVSASPEPPAAGSAAPSGDGPRDLSELRVPHCVCMTPFRVRMFVAGVFALAALTVSFGLAQVLFALAAPNASGGLQIVVGGALALLLGGAALWFCNPLDRQKWFRLALTREGFYFPGCGSAWSSCPGPRWSAPTSRAGTARAASGAAPD